MRNKISHYCLMMLCVTTLAFTSCSKDDNNETVSEPIPVVLSSKVYTMDAENGTILRSGEKFGVFMLKSGTYEPVNGYANVLHTADNYSATGYLIPSGTPMYYPTDGTKVDIVAYFPYDETLSADALSMRSNRADTHSNYIYEINLKNQKSAKVDDFLYAPQEKEHSSLNAKVQLQMRPVVARIKIVLEAGSDMSEQQMSKLLAYLDNMPTVAKFDLLHGTFLEVGEKEQVEMKLTTDAATGLITVQALLFPGLIDNDLKLVLKEEGNSGSNVQLILPLHEIFENTEKNTEYNVLAKVTSEGIEAELVGTSPIYIEDWQNDDNILDDTSYNPSELITNGSFENLRAEDFNIGTGVAKTDHTWFAVKNKVEGEAAIVKDNDQGNVLRMNFYGSEMSWYRNLIGHTMSGGKSECYHLQFKARTATKGSKMQVYVKVNKEGNHFFVLKGADTTKACAARTFSLTEEWKTYTIDFDLTKVVNTISTPTVTADGIEPVVASTTDDLSNFYIAFVTQSAGVDYFIDDVTMIKIEK